MADPVLLYGQMLDDLNEANTAHSDFSSCRSPEEIISHLEDLIETGELLLEEAANILNDLTGHKPCNTSNTNLN